MSSLSPRIRSFLLPITGGAAIMTILTLLASRFEPLVDAAWFGLNTQVYFGPGATVWVSLAIASAVSYLALLVIRAAIESSKEHPATQWAHSYLTFLMLFYMLVAAPCVMLVEVTYKSASWRSAYESTLIFLILQIFLIAALSAMLWVLTFHPPDYGRAARQIFLSVSVVLAVGQLLLDPGIVDLLGSMLRIGDTFDVVLPHKLPKRLAYLAPVTPLVWSAWRRWRSPQPAPGTPAHTASGA